MNKEDVGDPDLLHQPAVEGHALVAGAGEDQPLILPVMPQVEGHGEVLWEWGGDQTGMAYKALFLTADPPSTTVTDTSGSATRVEAKSSAALWDDGQGNGAAATGKRMAHVCAS